MTLAADAFCDHFGVRPQRPDRDLLHELGHLFSRLPYENLTKLIKKHRFPPGPIRRRLPDEVLAEHLTHGAGGTCFALTHLFASVLERLKFQCFPVLCDTRHRPDNHCALIVLLDSEPHLVDPGYLLHEPVPLASTADGAARVALVPGDPVGAAYDLYTYGTRRYRVKMEAVRAEKFFAVWDASFEWTMMNGVHLCSAAGDGYAYVHNHKLCLRDGQARTLNIRGSESSVLARRFGIDPEVIEQAYQVVAAARIAGQDGQDQND